MLFAYVGAQVELRKAVDAGDTGSRAEADAIHPEGNDADPGGAVEGVRHKSGGQQGRDGGGRNRPVGEEQVIPSLGDRPVAFGQRRWPVTGGVEDVLHFLVLAVRRRLRTSGFSDAPRARSASRVAKQGRRCNWRGCYGLQVALPQDADVVRDVARHHEAE